MSHERERVTRLLAVADQLGFTRDGVDGHGHIRLRHPNGTVRIPSTPGDWKGDKNAIADMQRVSGCRLQKVNHRRSRKAPHGTDFDPTLAARENRTFEGSDLAEQMRSAHNECVRLDDELTLLRERADRRTIGRFRYLYGRWQDAAAFLRAHHQAVPPDPARDAA